MSIIMFIYWSAIMPRPQRKLEPNLCHHITVRCNNREFNLIRQECRDLMLNAIHQARERFPFHLYALCIMSNHVHYLIKPDDPAQLPRIMHYIKPTCSKPTCSKSSKKGAR